jgi:hypothetical protein
MLAVLIGGMTKAKRDPAREERIEQEIIVDANSGEEQAMGWYYYLEDQPCFPFKAQCVAARTISPLRKGETVEVMALAPEDECRHEMFVSVKWENRTLAVPLMQLKPTDIDQATQQAVEDWHYWVRQGYEFAN